MIILTIRTDKPESEIGLYEDDKQLAYKTWEAHRQLAETLHTTIHELLKSQQKDWQDIEGILVYEGPGSFTGLRIGITVANTLAYSYSIPVCGAQGEEWLQNGKINLLDGTAPLKQVIPVYGSEAHITQAKK